MPTAAKAGAGVSRPGGIAEQLALVHGRHGPAFIEFLGGGQSFFLSLKEFN